MAQPGKITILNLGGGLNEGIPETDLAENECAKLENFYPFGPKLVRRNGLFQIYNTGGFIPRGLFAYRVKTGKWTLIMGTANSLHKFDESGARVALTPRGATPLSTNDADGFFTFLQYKDIGYCIRRPFATGKPGVNFTVTQVLVRFDDTYFELAGIPAPLVAPTIADGGAGALTAADYFTVYTYYNTTTGNESNPSPASAKLTLGASKLIRWSNVGISPTAQVNARRLYRTLPGQSGEYFFVATIPNNNDTGFQDNLAVSDMGAAVSFDNGTPPNNLITGDIFNERLFCTDGTDLFFSEIGTVEAYSVDNVIRVFPDDGHYIRAVHAHGSRLIIGKTNKIHFLTGTDRNDFAINTLSDRHGCYSGFSMKSIEGFLFWYGGDNVYRSDGTSVQSISTLKLRRTLDKVPDGRKEFVMAGVIPSLSWYILAMAQSDSATPTLNTVVACYNYKSDTWSIFKYPTLAPAVLADFFDANYGQVLYATFDSPAPLNIFQFNRGNLDYNDTPIAASLKTKAFLPAVPGTFVPPLGMLHASHRASIIGTSLSRNATLNVFRDGLAQAIKTRVVSLNGLGNNFSASPRDWKKYNLSSLGNPGNTLQFGLDYSGDLPIEIAGIDVETVQLVRAGQPG